MNTLGGSEHGDLACTDQGLTYLNSQINVKAYLFLSTSSVATDVMATFRAGLKKKLQEMDGESSAFR